MPGEPHDARRRRRPRAAVEAVPDGSSPDLVGVAVPLSGKYKAWGEAVLQGVALALEGSGQRVVREGHARRAGGGRRGARAAQGRGRDRGASAASSRARRSAPRRPRRSCRLPFVSLSRAERITEAGPFVFRNMLTAEAQARALVELAMRAAEPPPVRAHVADERVRAGARAARSGTRWRRAAARSAAPRAVRARPDDVLAAREGPRRQAPPRRAAPTTSSPREEIAEREKDPFRRRKALQKLRENLPPITDFDAVFVADFAANVALVAPALAVEDVVTATCDKRASWSGSGRRPAAPTCSRSSSSAGTAGTTPTIVEKAGRYVQCSIFVDGFFPGVGPAGDEAVRRGVPGPLRARAVHPRGVGPRRGGGGPAGPLGGRAEPRRGARGLSAVRGFPGATGTLSFDERREVSKPLFFLTVDAGGIRELRPEELAKPGAG